VITILDGTDFRHRDFRELLRLAGDFNDDALDRVIATELPGMSVLGHRTDGTLTGAAAFEPDSGSLEYIAVASAAQGRGTGTALVRAVREQLPGRDVSARTDDDAVDFYRRLGFTVTAAPEDPRWPGRRRYHCVLPGTARL